MRWVVFAAGLLCAAPVWADESCQLKEYASLELKTLPGGYFGVPVTLAGKDVILAVGIGAPYSFLDGSFTDTLGADAKKIPPGIAVEVGTSKSNGEVTVSDFRLGRISAKNARFARMDHLGYWGEAVGMLSLDILSGFDVEIDFTKHRMNLFSHENCPGDGVYWSDTYAEIPFTTDGAGHPMFRMELDGKDLTVGLDMAAHRGYMSTAAARRLFDIDPPPASPGNPSPQPVQHPFRELKIAGLTIENPPIEIDPKVPDCHAGIVDMPGNSLTQCFGLSDLQLGLGEIKKLHLYFAFKEKMLYVTAADAKP